MAAAVFVVCLVVLVIKGAKFSYGVKASYNFNITVLTDVARVEIIKTFAEKYARLHAISSNQLYIHVEKVNEDSGMLYILQQFSQSKFLKESSFVVTDLAVPTVLLDSLLRKPSVLIFDIRNRPLHCDNDISKNIISMRSSLKEQGKAMEHFSHRLGLVKVENLDFCFYESEEETVDPEEKINHRLMEIKSRKPDVIIVKCPKDLGIILKQIKHVGMEGDSFKWILPQMIGYEHMTSYLPHNVLTLGAHHSHDVSKWLEEDYLGYLEDSFTVIQMLAKKIKNLDILEEEDMTPIKSSLKRFLSDTNVQTPLTKIQFNDKGCRTNVSYNIYEMVSFYGERRWLRVGSWLDGKINTIFMQWTGNNSGFQRQIFRVVTYFGKPWVSYVSIQKKIDGRCLVGHVCRNYTNKETLSMSDTADEDSCYSGFMIDFLLKLQQLLNFKAQVHFVKDQKFGSLNRSESSRWTGIIGELERGEADIGLHLLTITAERLKVVAFSQPFMEAANDILVSSQAYSHSIWNFVFLDTFSGDIWSSMLMVCIMVVMVMWFAERLRLRRRYLVKPHKSHRSFSLPEIISYVWSLGFQKAAEEMGPTSLAGRLLAGLFAFWAIIACSSFTANLAAIKVTERRGISISGIHDSKFQNPNKDFKFSTLADSAGMDYFRGNSDPALRRMAAFLERNAVENFPEAAEKLKSGKIHAFLGDVPILKILSSQGNCELRLAGKPFFFSGYGIAFSKNFMWLHQFSLAILQLQDEGFFDELIEKWVPQHCANVDNPRGPESLGLNEVGGSLLLLLLGAVVGALLLFVEYLVWNLFYVSIKR